MHFAQRAAGVRDCFSRVLLRNDFFSTFSLSGLHKGDACWYTIFVQAVPRITHRKRSAAE